MAVVPVEMGLGAGMERDPWGPVARRICRRHPSCMAGLLRFSRVHPLDREVDLVRARARTRAHRKVLAHLNGPGFRFPLLLVEVVVEILVQVLNRVLLVVLLQVLVPQMERLGRFPCPLERAHQHHLEAGSLLPR